MFGPVLDIVLLKELTMKNMITSLVMLLCLSSLSAQSENAAVILISSQSTPDFIKEMKKDLKKRDLVLNVEKEIWASQTELEEFGFTLTNKKTKVAKKFHLRYNELNKHQVLLIYPSGDESYGEVVADVHYLRTELLPLVVTKKIRRHKPSLHRSYASSGDPYLQFTALKDLEELEEKMEETVTLFKHVKADMTVGQSISNITYTYNGILLEDPSGINLKDMSADVLIENLEDDSKIINIWSDQPLNELIGAAIVGQE